MKDIFFSSLISAERDKIKTEEKIRFALSARKLRGFAFALALFGRLATDRIFAFAHATGERSMRNNFAKDAIWRIQYHLREEGGGGEKGKE